MEEKNQHLLQPLIQTITTNSVENDYEFTSSNAIVILRLVLIIFVGVVSLWASYEASKGFAITIVNETNDQSTFASKRFNLFFVSNDEATRLILKTSKFVENILYPMSDHQDSYQPHIKKQVKHVSLQLSSRNLTRPIIIKSSQHDDEFVLHISPSILEGSNYKHDMFLALQKGMARIWLWDGQGNAPSNLVNGMIDYITNLASSSGRVTSESELVESVALGRRCWKSKDTRTIVKSLNYCEGRKEGFVRRLNKEMKNGWHEKMIDDALGMPAWHLCETYNKEVF
ncbi:uncharacterized protein LOC132054781 [Lycium ferocissimum]|uniref:uncharacterized protein LOC132054781 n=1 Tax=Lycium ferocissimum TaxID=112874 RepID=UPI0028154D9C|nr:uncharacterized protein LOC132054781 [Lycium ferocissimum]